MFSKFGRVAPSLRVAASFGAIATLGGMSIAACDFKYKSFSPTLNAPDGTSAPLILAGTGMRRKSLYILEVDVYEVGFYVEKQTALPAVKKAQTAGSDALQEALSAKNVNFAKNSGPMAAVNLKFVRGVGQDAIVEAFNDAFKGLDEEAVLAFKTATKKAIGDKGMTTGEEFSFFWYGDGRGLVVAKKNGEMHSVPSTPKVREVEQRLLGVYLDSKTTVSPELVKSINENVQSV